jgi:hypothetical protein
VERQAAHTHGTCASRRAVVTNRRRWSVTAKPLAQMNTCVCYKYRDAANYKFPGAVVLEGLITEEQIRPHLHEGLYFIPGDVRLPGLHPTHCEFAEDMGTRLWTLRPGAALWTARGRK